MQLKGVQIGDMCTRLRVSGRQCTTAIMLFVSPFMMITVIDRFVIEDQSATAIFTSGEALFWR
jgi:hypothetical protein